MSRAFLNPIEKTENRTAKVAKSRIILYTKK